MKLFFGGRLGLLLVFLLVAGRVMGQAPTWQMALALSTPADGSTSVSATAADASGNVYIAGAFHGTAIFGATTLTSTDPGYYDLFVAKWSPATGFVWARQAGGTNEDVATALAVSGGNVYVVGRFDSPTLAFGATTLTNAGSDDGYVAKLTDAGSTSAWTWAQPIGGTAYDRTLAVAASGSSVYVTGLSASPTLAFGATTLPNAGPYYDGFVAKLTDAGSTSAWTWAQPVAGTNEEVASAIAVDGGSVYVAGYFGSPTLAFGATTLTPAGAADVFVAKLTDAGSTSAWTWAQRAGGTDSDRSIGLAVSGSSVYVTGLFNSPSLPFGATTLSNAGMYDGFVAKLTDAGSSSAWTWAQAVAGTDADGGYALAVSGNNVYVVGNFGSPTLALGATTLTNTGNAGGNDGFVAKLTDAGSTSAWTWAQPMGGSYWDAAFTLTLSGGSVYVGGYFSSSTMRFGSIFLINPNLFANVGFLAALTDPALATPAEAPAAPFSLAPNPAHHAATLTGATAPTATLLDALGRVVRVVPVMQGAATLDVRGLPAGLYTVRAGGRARRLVVE